MFKSVWIAKSAAPFHRCWTARARVANFCWTPRLRCVFPRVKYRTERVSSAARVRNTARGFSNAAKSDLFVLLLLCLWETVWHRFARGKKFDDSCANAGMLQFFGNILRKTTISVRFLRHNLTKEVAFQVANRNEAHIITRSSRSRSPIRF